MQSASLANLIIIISFIIVVSLTSRGSSKDVNLLVLIPWSGSWPVGKSMASAIPIALEDVNSRSQLLPNRTLRYVWNDTRCDAGDGLYEMVNMWMTLRENLHAIIGGACDVVCEPAGLLAGKWNIPMVSWGCSSSVLSNRVAYPTLTRTVGPSTKMGPVFVALMKHWGWTRCGILTSSQNVWQLTAHQVKIDLENANATVGEFYTFDPGHMNITGKEKTKHKDLLRDFSKKVRSKQYFLANLLINISYFDYSVAHIYLDIG